MRNPTHVTGLMVTKSNRRQLLFLSEQPLNGSHRRQQFAAVLWLERLEHPRDIDALPRLQFAKFAASFGR